MITLSSISNLLHGCTFRHDVPPSRAEIEKSPLLTLTQQGRDAVLAVLNEYPPNCATQDVQKIAEKLAFMAHSVSRSFGDLDRVRGAWILDVGCGARAQDPADYGALTARYEPWMPRLLTELGAEVVGVDVRPQIGERFRSVQADLTKPDALKGLPAARFDAYYMEGIQDGRFLAALDAASRSMGALSVSDMEDKLEDVVRNIDAEISRVLRASGRRIRGIYDLGYSENLPSQMKN